MKFSKRKILLLTCLVTAALLGLIIIQVSLLKVAYEQKEIIFNQNITSALNQTSKLLQEGETATEIFQFASNDSTHNIPSRKNGIRKIAIEDKDKNRKNTRRPKIFLSVNSFPDTGSFNILYHYESDSLKTFSSFSFDDEVRKLKKLDSTKKKQMVASVVDRLIITDRLPIEKRVTVSKIDSLLKINLANSGITLAYSFGVNSGLKDSLKLIMYKGNRKDFEGSSLKTMLFPSDISPVKSYITIGFPDSNLFIYKQIMPQLFLSLIFLLAIIISFVITIRTIYTQKRLSSHIIDFINNMTHEFKTPISTIGLASEAIAKPETLTNEERLSKYNTIIRDENVRMKQQVERILQMAVIEQGEYDLNIQCLDIDDIISVAVKNISLKVEARGGKIQCVLGAASHSVYGDQVHLNNIIHNILDNAEKYSSGNPVITIRTENKGGNILISISDNGIGIKEDDLNRIFDKYYRVSTGNIHDVKGFGLGLSYVKLLTKAQGGKIEIISSPGKGTTVILSFPVIPG